MKIIKSSPFADDWSMQICCPRCRAVLEVDKSDLKVDYYSDQREGSYYTCNAACISCQNVMNVGAPKELIEFLYKTRTKSYNHTSAYYDH